MTYYRIFEILISIRFKPKPSLKCSLSERQELVKMDYLKIDSMGDRVITGKGIKFVDKYYQNRINKESQSIPDVHLVDDVIRCSLGVFKVLEEPDGKYVAISNAYQFRGTLNALMKTINREHRIQIYLFTGHTKEMAQQLAND